ncbi:MAG: DUF885 family protein [Clostridium sp.]|nr:DUF885 family protein [Clostridium sp.]
MKKASRDLALCGVLCALAVAIMAMGTILPVATYCAPVLASMTLLPVLILCGEKLSWAMFFASAMLSLLLALSLFGCSAAPKDTAAPIATEAPAAASAPTPEPEPTEDTARAEAEAALKELDGRMFAESVVSDALSFHLTVAHPENFPLITDYPTGWGEFTYAEQEASNEENIAWLEELYAIDRNVLSDDSRITYDTLVQFLEQGIEGNQYYYYNEVLDTFVGLHSNLPLNLVFYDMHTKADVENYLTLLADTPRYVGQVLAFEQEKSADGKFMRDNALDKVLEQIKAFMDARETCFLFATFDEFIADIDELSDEERAAYSARNTELVNALIDSYQVLYDGLEALRGTATTDGALYTYGEEGKAFFATELKYNACADITPEEALKILYDELNAQLSKLYDAAKKDAAVFDKYDTVELSVGTTEENIEYLKELMADYYPELPEHTLTFMDCPSELEDQFSPAAYLIPPVDDASENLIILNNKTLENDNRYLDTLAHEGYPGHLYHYQYLRTLINKTGYTRQALSNLTSAYFGDEAATELKDVYYDYAVENPFYFLEYAMGYSIYQQKLREAEDICGASFDLRSFHETYLNIGPTYFNISMPIMDEWISEHK